MHPLLVHAIGTVIAWEVWTGTVRGRNGFLFVTVKCALLAGWTAYQTNNRGTEHMGSSNWAQYVKSFKGRLIPYLL